MNTATITTAAPVPTIATAASARLAERIAALPAHAKRLGGAWRLGWSDDLPLVWLPPEPTAAELSERERRGQEF